MTAQPDPPPELLARLCAGVEDPRPAPCTVIGAPRPGDEVVGAGARLPRLREAVIVHVTDDAPGGGRGAGAAGEGPPPEAAETRRREALAALARAGIPPARTRALRCADGEAALVLDGLAEAPAALFAAFRPPVVTVPYEGVRPDRDATAFGVHAACDLLALREPAPALVEMTVRVAPSEGVARYGLVPVPDDADGHAVTLALSADERAFKRRLFHRLASQREVLRSVPLEAERVRLAPRYEFTRPPLGGALRPDGLERGATDWRFQQPAAAARAALRLALPSVPAALPGSRSRWGARRRRAP